MANWQPRLTSQLLTLRPMLEEDETELYEAARDPLIWALHPEPTRWQRDVFEKYFRSGLASKGALVVIDPKTQTIIGASRFHDHREATRSVEIGWTFLTRRYWGGAYNRELKRLMLEYAFTLVDSVYFVVGAQNWRSQRAMQKIGGTLVTDVPLDRDFDKNVAFVIRKFSGAGAR